MTTIKTETKTAVCIGLQVLLENFTKKGTRNNRKIYMREELLIKES